MGKYPKCSSCTRPNNTRFKCCSPCRESVRKCLHKRRHATPVCKPGEKYCKQCFHTKPVSHFQKRVNRATGMTAWCDACRDSLKRSQVNPTSKKGECKQVYEAWKASHPCLHCGTTDPQVIEADHLRDKVHRCSGYPWWACHGGPAALTLELEKCQALCRFCHTIKTQEERNTWKQKDRLEKRAIINAEKDKRGKCFHCHRKVTPGTYCGFDFDHLKPKEKLIGVSQLVKKSWSYFDEYAHDEMAKCQLLCKNCHNKKTHY